MTGQSAGPFVADKETWSARELENGEMLAVMDGTGEMFCYVQLNDCAGMDKAAAKARATRIAESLNRTEGHPVELDAEMLDAARAWAAAELEPMLDAEGFANPAHFDGRAEASRRMIRAHLRAKGQTK